MCRIEQEAEALIAMGTSMVRSRPDMAATLHDVETILDEAIRQRASIETERGFEQAGRRLRSGWLKSVAAETARVLRSPTEREIERLEHSRHDAYGYERDFQPESLEARCEAFFGPPPPGWTATHIMFSSGQAALATLLMHLAEPRPGKLRLAHVGSYFETRELVTRTCTSAKSASDADAVIVEPLACNGRFSTHDPAAIAARLGDGQFLILDETLTAPATRAPAILEACSGRAPTVVRLISGLKLLQQGLELSNVGVLSAFTTDPSRTAELREGLTRLRTLVGTGLRFVDALALEAPFFLDSRATGAYADRIFAHNADLARSVSVANSIFKPLGSGAEALAPYCAFELATGNSVESLSALADRIEREAQARGLLFERGGSFGFRGHRYEVIEPETGEAPFLRVALGAREDRSCAGIIGLMAEIAADRA